MQMNLRALALVLGLCALGLPALLSSPAAAQNYIRVTTCGDARPPAGAGNGYMDATGQVCVAATATATTTATASATPTAVSAGTGKPLNIDLFSELFVQPAFAGTPVDGTHGLPVNCIVGCSGGPADESAFTAGTTPIVTGGFFQTTATSNPLSTGQAGSVQMTSTRSFFVNLRNNAGAEAGVAAVPLQVSLANTAANATPVNVAGTGTAGTANAGVVTVQGIASMTKLLVTPDSVALPANQSVNTAQVNGVTTLTGTGAVGTGAQRVAVGTDTATIAGSAPGTAGTPSTNVVSVQGVASGTPQPLSAASGSIASGAVASGALAAGAGTDGWNVTGGAKADAVCGTATGTCSEQALLKFANTQLQSLVSGLLTPPLQVISGASKYNTIAASQTAQVLTGGSGGAVGDYLSHCVVIPTSTSPGVVTILDNATTVYAFPGGASSLSNLVPFTIPVGALSVSAAWKITTGAGLSVTCVGRFT